MSRKYKSISEHKYEFERWNKCTIISDSPLFPIIHHINGNKSDNDYRNLQLMSKSEHVKLHGNGFDGKKHSKETIQKMSGGRPELVMNKGPRVIKAGYKRGDQYYVLYDFGKRVCMSRDISFLNTFYENDLFSHEVIKL